MKCPYCASVDLKVIDKRDAVDFDSIRRRRECLKCNKRFTTFERIEKIELVVDKKNGSKEQFSREKLKAGFIVACEKRPVSLEQIDGIIDKIILELRKKNPSVVKSSTIGTIVVKHLRKLDEVAYLRFASVYKDFNDINSFKKEIDKMDKRGGK